MGLQEAIQLRDKLNQAIDLFNNTLLTPEIQKRIALANPKQSVAVPVKQATTEEKQPLRLPVPPMAEPTPAPVTESPKRQRNVGMSADVLRVLYKAPCGEITLVQDSIVAQYDPDKLRRCIRELQREGKVVNKNHELSLTDTGFRHAKFYDAFPKTKKMRVNSYGSASSS